MWGGGEWGFGFLGVRRIVLISGSFSPLHSSFTYGRFPPIAHPSFPFPADSTTDWKARIMREFERQATEAWVGVGGMHPFRFSLDRPVVYSPVINKNLS